MKDRWVAAKRRTVLLGSVLGIVGLLLVPIETHARSAGAASAGGAGATHGRSQGRVAKGNKGKRKHLKKAGRGEVMASGKTASPGRARVRQEKVVCAEAFGKAKEIARDSHFRAANEWFAVCARPSCNRSLRKKCAAVHEKIAALIPSVVPVVTDAPDNEGRDVEVRMDGDTLTSNLDGTPIAVDPGDHEFTFSKDGEVFAKKTFPVEKGQRNQIVAVPFPSAKQKRVDLTAVAVAEERASAPAPSKGEPTEAASDRDSSESAEAEPVAKLGRRERTRQASVEAEPSSGTPWSAYALAGVGLLGVGGYGVFNLKGSAQNDALVALCKPDCNPTSVKHVRNLYLAADISLGIGIAALLGSTYLFLRSDSGSEETSRASHISGLSVSPTRSGALATVGGTF